MAENDILFVRGDEEDEDDEDPWDDTLLIRAYDSALETAKKEIAAEGGTSGVTSVKPAAKEKGRKNWKKGNYCRVKYSVDGIVYEAKITKITGDTCTVKYLGYENEEVVPMKELRPSKGGPSRRQQLIDARYDVEASEYGSELEQTGSAIDLSISAGSTESELLHIHSNRVEPPLQHPRPVGPPLQHPLYPEGIHVILPEQMVPPGEHFSPSQHILHMEELPEPPLPPPPPLAQNLQAPADSGEALNAMLMSWYMSGYHTGYYQGLRRGEQSK